MRIRVPIVLALLLLAGAYAPGVRAQPVPAPTTAPSPPSAAPAPSPTPAPSPAPTPTPAPPPTPTATPSASPYHFIVTPPSPAPGQPAIVEIDMLDSTLHAGAPYSVRVKTSLDVTALNVSTMGQTYGMQGAAPGLFASDGQVPGAIPFFLLNRPYAVTISALTADGRSTSTTITLRLER